MKLIGVLLLARRKKWRVVVASNEESRSGLGFIKIVGLARVGGPRESICAAQEIEAALRQRLRLLV